MLKEVHFTRTYSVSGDPDDAYFASLPANDLGALFSYVSANQAALANSTVLDVGANIGLAAICISDLLPDAKIHSFEPSRISLPFLIENLHSHNALESTSIHDMAIGEDSRSVTFADQDGNYAGSKVNGVGNSYIVKQISIDKFVRQYDLGRVGFIKIDVEGYEISALRGASSVLKSHSPLVMFECNPMALRMSKTPLSRFLSDAISILGQLHVFEYGGTSHALPADSNDAEKMLLSMMTNDHHVFDLVNRIN